MPLLFDLAAPQRWRQAFLIEHAFPGDPTPEPPPNSALEPPDPFDLTIGAPNGPQMPPVFQGIRTAGQRKYIEYQNGEAEFYNLKLDPFELQNTAATADPNLLARLAAGLEQLKDCAGSACRQAEESLHDRSP